MLAPGDALERPACKHGCTRPMWAAMHSLLPLPQHPPYLYWNRLQHYASILECHVASLHPHRCSSTLAATPSPPPPCHRPLSSSLPTAPPPLPGTGRTGFLAVAPNNYPFYHGAEVYTPVMQKDGGQLSGGCAAPSTAPSALHTGG